MENIFTVNILTEPSNIYCFKTEKMEDYDAESLDAAGFELCCHGAFDEAIKLFSKAIEKDPTNGVYYTDRCCAYIGKLDIDKAMEDGKKGVELCPDNARCHMQLGVLYDFKKEWEKGLECHEKALELEPNSEAYWGMVRHDKARLMKRGEKPATGLEFLEFLDSKGEETAYLARSPQLYHFLDDISQDFSHCINYLGNPLMDLFAEHMMGGSIPPEIGARRVPVAKVKKEYEDAMKEMEEKKEKEKDENN